MDFTVDDIIGARPSLRERAKKEHQKDMARRQMEKEDTWAELELEAKIFSAEHLLAQPGEIQDIKFEHSMRATDSPAVSWTMDSIRFRAYFLKKKMLEKNSSLGDEIIYEEIAKFEVLKATTWKAVASLADVGAVLD